MIEDNLAGRSGAVADPRYAPAMTKYQSGDWAAAIEEFEALALSYPESETIRRTLEEARIRADRADDEPVRGKRVVFNWRPWLFRSLAVVAIAVFAITGWQILNEQLPPLLEAARLSGERTQLLTTARSQLDAGNLDAAQQAFETLLAIEPEHPEALAGLEEIAEQRELLELYEEALALEEAGEFEAALQRYSDLIVLDPSFRDVRQRVLRIQRELDLAQLFVEADTAYDEGRWAEAISLYEQVRDLDLDYQKRVVLDRLYDLYVTSGREIVERSPPTPQDLPQALDYFTLALQLRPRDDLVAEDQRLAGLFLQGLEAGYAQRWEDAILSLRPIYDRRPDYMDGLVVDLLYAAYIRSGDRYQEGGDLYLAYEQYQQAERLPVTDPALALGRTDAVRPFLTPTPTPTITPTPAPTQPPVAAVPPLFGLPSSAPSFGGGGSGPGGSGPVAPIATPRPTPMPTPTPIPLSLFRGQIVFRSDNPDQPGIYVMDATGANRRYLGPAGSYERALSELRKEEIYSPDGRYSVIVQESPEGPQVFMTIPWTEQWGNVPPRQITRVGKLSYDPVWAPDGSLIAFVSQADGNDEVYVTNTEGTWFERLTFNTWEWDKHPSWSPDASRIVFWSNRTGNQQIHVVNARGGGLRNISNNGWDEYDPIWIK